MNLQDLFTKHALYESVKSPYGEDENKNSLHIYYLLTRESSFDMYCVECSSHSIFKKVKTELNAQWKTLQNGDGVPVVKNGEHLIYANCSRNESHRAMILIKSNNSSLIKIGQFPALADVLTPDLKRYKNAIGEQRINEWSRAIGLTSHGIGVGAFVYLRRIVESLIEDAHQEAKKTQEWNEENYIRSRFTEKIEMLHGFLPKIMIENKTAYGILSKGVHELDEKTCLHYFPVLNAAIELIAEEKNYNLELEKRKKSTKDAILKIKNQIEQS